MEISGRTALVTGANRGIGAAIVNALFAAGAARVYAGMRTPPNVSPGTRRRIWLISNEADLVVNNAAGATLVQRWQATGATTVSTFRFPRHLNCFTIWSTR